MGTYFAGSWPACPRQRSETLSMSVGPRVDADARHPVRAGSIGDRGHRELERVRRRVRVQVVVDDPDDRELMDRRDVQRLVPPAVGGRAVAADRHRDPRLTPHLVRKGCAARDGIRDRQVGHHGPRPVPLPVADMAVAVAAARVAVDPAPELRHHAVQVQPLGELGRKVTMRREQRVVLAKGCGHPHMGALLPASRVDRAREPPLPVQRLHALVEVPTELERVQELSEPLVGEPDAPVLGREALLLYLRRHVMLHAEACRRARGTPRRCPPTRSDADGSGPRRRPGPPPTRPPASSPKRGR